MNHGLKALLLAASTIITCMIVGLGFAMAREAKQLGNTVTEELHRYRVAVEEQDYTKYDQALVYGSDVVNLMTAKLSEEQGGFSITVSEKTGCRTYTCEADAKKAREPGENYYIVPTAEYSGEVIRDKNQVIVGIVFTKKEETEDSNE